MQELSTTPCRSLKACIAYNTNRGASRLLLLQVASTSLTSKIYFPHNSYSSSMPVKRKTAATTASGTAKRAKNDVHENAKLIVAEAVSTPDAFELHCDINDEDSVRRSMLQLAMYAHSLEGEVKEMKHALATTGNKTEKAVKSPEKVAEEVERLSVTIARGIKRQMSVSAFC